MILHQILLQLYHFYTGTKSNIISLNLEDINLRSASEDYFSVLCICPKAGKNCCLLVVQRGQIVFHKECYTERQIRKQH